MLIWTCFINFILQVHHHACVISRNTRCFVDLSYKASKSIMLKVKVCIVVIITNPVKIWTKHISVFLSYSCTVYKSISQIKYSFVCNLLSTSEYECRLQSFVSPCIPSQIDDTHMHTLTHFQNTSVLNSVLNSSDSWTQTRYITALPKVVL